jgi:hypothetical protein
MAQGNISGAISQCTMDNGLRIKLMEEESMFGPMVEGLKAPGKKIICTEEECTPGKTEESMKVNILMTENMVTESTLGPMEENILDNGKMESSMAKAYTGKHLDRKREDIGRMGKDSSGLTIEQTIHTLIK